jgi:hypothetical protein
MSRARIIEGRNIAIFNRWGARRFGKGIIDGNIYRHDTAGIYRHGGALLLTHAVLPRQDQVITCIVYVFFHSTDQCKRIFRK